MYMFAYLKQNSKTFSDNSFEKFASIYDEISLSKSDSTSSSSVSESESKGGWPKWPKSRSKDIYNDSYRSWGADHESVNRLSLTNGKQKL